MLDALGNLGDFIGGIAVIATLLYLAVQVRQNTASVRAASRQDIVESFRAFNRQLFVIDGLPEIYVDGLRRYPDMPQPARTKFGAYMVDQALHFQSAFALHESGALEDETYASYLTVFASLFTTPGGSALWAELRLGLPPRMVAVIDQRSAAGEVPSLLDSPMQQE